MPNPTPARKGERRRDTSLRSPSPEITRAYLVPQHFLVWRVTLPILSLTPHKQVATRTRTHQEGRYLILPLTPFNGCALGENLNTDQSSRDRCCIFFAVRLGLLVLAGASRLSSLCSAHLNLPPTITKLRLRRGESGSEQNGHPGTRGVPCDWRALALVVTGVEPRGDGKGGLLRESFFRDHSRPVPPGIRRSEEKKTTAFPLLTSVKDTPSKIRAGPNGGAGESLVHFRRLLRRGRRRRNGDAGRADRHGRCQGHRVGYRCFAREPPAAEAEQCVAMAIREWRQPRQVHDSGDNVVWGFSSKSSRNYKYRRETAAARRSIGRDGNNGAILHPRRSPLREEECSSRQQQLRRSDVHWSSDGQDRHRHDAKSPAGDGGA